MKKIFTVTCLLVTLLLLASCAKKPENAGVKAAIEASLRAEAEAAGSGASGSGTSFILDDMEVPMRKAGKAWAVIWNEDKSVQRNYVVEYDKKEKAVKVVSFTESVFDENSNSYVPK